MINNLLNYRFFKNIFPQKRINTSYLIACFQIEHKKSIYYCRSYEFPFTCFIRQRNKQMLTPSKLNSSSLLIVMMGNVSNGDERKVIIVTKDHLLTVKMMEKIRSMLNQFQFFINFMK